MASTASAAATRLRVTEGTRDCATIAGAGLLVAIVLRPFPDAPFIDDWAYSWSVQHLLETGDFLFPEVVLNPIVTQVLWGALFCLPFGFSLAALRVSTWVLGVLAVCGLCPVRELSKGGRACRPGGAVRSLAFIRCSSSSPRASSPEVQFLAAMLWSAFFFCASTSPAPRGVRVACGSDLRGFGRQPRHRPRRRRRDDCHVAVSQW